MGDRLESWARNASRRRTRRDALKALGIGGVAAVATACFPPPPPGCPSGQTSCSGHCKNLQTDITNCGTCGHVCGSANGTATCAAGICGITCAPGFVDCDGNPSTGCEISILTDPNNCGACGHICSSYHGTGTCNSGTCSTVCDPGYFDCDGNPSTGCEVNVQTDPLNCGGCNMVCPPFQNAASICVAGACHMGTCAPGYLDCDGMPSTGCETYILSDPHNCGGCGMVCNATQICSAGVCS